MARKAKKLGVEDRVAGRLERRIRRKIAGLKKVVRAASALGQIDTDIKAQIRNLHDAQRAERLSKAQSFIAANAADLLTSIADGCEVEPLSIKPVLQVVEPGTREARLFRFAALSWSVPVSEGYGRRMRFLVWDQSNGKLIGLFALGDPVFNLKARDDLIGWNANERQMRLVNIMDAFVVGAVPPYSKLLGGKLVACLIRSREVRNAFRKRYGRSLGVISNTRKDADLVAVTTSSSLGRSSLYNRLTLSGQRYFNSIGYTSGYGHFHVPAHLFSDLRELLIHHRHSYANGNRFGNGPNWRFRSIRAALELLGYDRAWLNHGIKRELYLCTLAANAMETLQGKQARPNFRGLLTADAIGEMGVDRWMVPRSIRTPEFKEWHRGQFLSLLTS